MSSKTLMIHTQNLIELTKQPLHHKESLVERNLRLGIIVDTLAYLVSQRVELSDMKDIMGELHQVIEDS
jgi:hypothetical protein